ncbi:hypothetical protein METBIDRAFT_47622 [Metschnikowia bicuspidata var. bicuspidata NRRL YB-4993]|uniref:Uncharacterized protein n=1 Tax=Metschnikowia bicuspidata var. bicuspidata NRRL YB-4993 TaxID=869754 RepID=A0A1A0H295_9ASCO|nr:hypothetical protein METBIDRAFT_47622 [Metschnikowia bicuspidata var. bicuspidata NRRL YB-4993]OBA18047.1 hypothetical protein METBIDRAFT_47622 [Metschnikowia bicuspidata var. bicuspidata NRRL YB-4993]
MHARDWFMVFLAVLLPPLPVAVKRGFSMDLLINVCLSIFVYLPGLIHALYIISKYPEPESHVHLGEHDQPQGYGAV